MKTDNQQPCCGPKTVERKSDHKFISTMVNGQLSTFAGSYPRVSAELSKEDKWGTWKARLGIKRMSYEIEPGLYALGNPSAGAPVLVTANYKMSFDALRQELSGLDAWILVLDTFGINVWCAAGKGTFGTDELISRIAATKLAQVVTHRTLILPQLGAPGVAAHVVQKQSGFKVIYGPVRATDVKAFIESGLKATPEMRRVQFTFYDRLILTPLEFYLIIKPLVLFLLAVLALSLFGLGNGVFGNPMVYLGAALVGSVVVPLLLPYIPSRAFSLKGLWVALVYVAAVIGLSPGLSWQTATIYILICSSISTYAAMNFTGASTYTSLSGVEKEMKIAIPALVISVAVGLIIGVISWITPFLG